MDILKFIVVAKLSCGVFTHHYIQYLSTVFCSCFKVSHLNHNLVSLKGPRGERGADGFPGKPGPKVL